MASPEDEATVLLGYKVDQSSIQTAILANTKVLQSVQAVGTGVQTVAEQMAAAGASAEEIFAVTGETISTGVTAPIDAADSSVKMLIHDIGDLGRDIESIPEPDLSAFGVEGGDTGGGGGGGGSLFAQRRGLSAIGSLAGGQIGGDVGDAARLISAGAAFGAVGVAAGVAAIAVKKLTDEETARTKAAQDAADALNKIAEGAAGGTTESIQKQIVQQTQYKQNLEDTGKQLADYNDKIQQTAIAYQQGLISSDEYTSVLHLLGQDVSDLTGGAVDAGAAVSNINGIIADNQKSVDAASISIGGLNIQLTSSAVVANDAAIAAQKLAKTQEDAVNLSIQIDGLTKTQRDQRAEQDRRDIALINDRIQQGDLSNQATYDLLQQQDKLYKDYQALTSVSNTYADDLEREAAAKAALTKQDQNYLDAIASEGDTRSKIAGTLADIAQTEADRDAKVLTLQKTRDDTIAADESAAGDKRAEIVQNKLDNINKIETESGQQLANDIAFRDSLQHRLDQQKEDTALLNEQKTADKQLATVATNLAKQEAVAKASFQKSADDLYDSTVAKLAIERRTYAQEQVDLMNEQNAEQSLAYNNANYLINVHGNMWNVIGNLAAQGAARLQQLISGAVGTAYTETLGGSGTAFNNAFDARLNQTLASGHSGTYSNGVLR